MYKRCLHQVSGTRFKCLRLKNNKLKEINFKLGRLPRLQAGLKQKCSKLAREYFACFGKL